MNKKAIIALVLILLALIFGYFFLNKNSKVSNSVDTNSETSSGPKSLKDLLAGGISQKCTFDSTEESGGSEGTVYVSKGKVRGDFSVTSSGKKMVNHMIVDGNTSYMWMDGEKNGYKMSFDVNSDSSVSSSPVSSSKSQGEVSPDAKMDYNCSTWVVDSSVFVAPSDVKFVEFSAPTYAPQGSGSGENSSQCSYCNNLTGDSKSQCLAALGCK